MLIPGTLDLIEMHGLPMHIFIFYICFVSFFFFLTRPRVVIGFLGPVPRVGSLSAAYNPSSRQHPKNTQ